MNGCILWSSYIFHLCCVCFLEAFFLELWLEKTSRIQVIVDGLTSIAWPYANYAKEKIIHAAKMATAWYMMPSHRCGIGNADRALLERLDKMVQRINFANRIKDPAGWTYKLFYYQQRWDKQNVKIYVRYMYICGANTIR